MLPGGELDQLVRMFCPKCADERPFEQPECLDGHGADCPERACVECGAAVLLGPLTQPEPARVASQDRPGQRVVRPAVADLDLPVQSTQAGSTQAGSAPAQSEARRRVGSGRTPRSLA
ncbi:hypothetical protein [Pseudofrankia inefficax]|uniref:Uncharacterized protein n=1 Tax=Pseudofrankia inefficax (strain DSM 45817 / CECT 9037 / DDB 130130 / EuI1c) TaxID=298654 RepID=E3IZ45_PSEI1|nr:hypothetical protein [Pseudofrankia inefficax]ADP80328.1 hypothetical protein FraEuI1c_2289 [Pseudofrankia inefficax]